MKACRKNAWAITTMAAVAVSFAVTTAALAKPNTAVPRAITPTWWDGQVDGSAIPPSGLNASAGPVCESTGFEPVEASCQWEPGWMCGSTFTNCTGPPLPAGCDPDPLVTGNCCADSPNPLNGWYLSISSEHCNEPHVDTVNPATGEQHLRIAADPTGGNPPGCTGFGGACRVTAFTPTTGGPLPVGPTLIEFDIAMELPFGTPPFGSSMIYFTVGDNEANTLGLYTYFHYYGLFFAYDWDLATFALVGYLNGSESYQHVSMNHDPCAGTTTYEIEGFPPYVANINSASQGLTVERAIFNGNNIGGSHDIDNYSVVRGEECVTECGNDVVEPGEHCEPNDTAGCCPGACVAAGEEGECTCTRDNTIFNCQTRDVVNGANGPFLTDGGMYSYTADTPFTLVDTCGSDYDTEIIWNIDETCGFFELYNDECIPSTFGGAQVEGSPHASCYDDSGGFPGESCMCVPTDPGTTYTFLVDAYYFSLVPPICSSTVVNITKMVDCEAGPIPGGACCDRVAGTCVDGVEEAECTGENLIYTTNKTCDQVDCAAATGACCDSSPGSGGACTDGLTFADCNGPQLTWSKDQACADVTCEEARGACCDGLIGSCTGGALQSQCGCEQCTWTKGASCSSVTCNPALGACCDTGTEDPLVSICEQTIMVDCNCEKCSWTKGASCSEIVCDPNFIPIPTVSEWGLVIMALLLLVGGKVYFGRRQTATA